MRLLIVRHADPDYSIDSLTPAGWEEAKLLADRLAPIPVAAYYVSPLGRAKDTASLTLKKACRTAETCSWLREFAPQAVHPGKDSGHCVWDWLPDAWMAEPKYFDKDHWHETEVFQNAHVKEEYDWVTGELDRLLSQHGYERNGLFYRAVAPNEDTIVLFCHFGVECVLLKYLSDAALARNLCGAVVGDGALYRRAPLRRRILPHEPFWGCFSSVCGWTRAVVCGAVL